MRVTVFVFAVELQKVGNKCTSTDFWERTGASFKMAYMWKGEDSIEKNLFFENSHRDITVRAQYDKDGASVKIKVS